MGSQPSGAGARLREALLWPVRWGSETFTHLLAEKRVVDGFALYDATGGSDPGGTLDRLRGGLALLAELDERRYRRLRRDIPHLLVASTGDNAYYPATRSGMVRATLVNGHPPASIALQLVELGARARMANMLRGSLFVGERNRRALRRAVREQMAFAARLDPERFSGLHATREWLEDALSRYS